MAKKALITGVTGQDGSYLSEFLLEKGYEVHGIIRRSSVDFRERIAHLEGKPHFHLHYADLGDSMSIVKVVDKVQPDEIYNLAAQSQSQTRLEPSQDLLRRTRQAHGGTRHRQSSLRRRRPQSENEPCRVPRKRYREITPSHKAI